MSSKKVERRQGVRISFTGPVNYRDLGHAGQIPGRVTVVGEIVDLSNAGMRIRTKEQSLEEGTVVRAEIPVTDNKIAVPVLSQVLWVTEGKAGAYEAGLRFML